jgi:Zn-dependent metalloprotease
MKKIILAGVLFVASQNVSAQANSGMQAYVQEVSYNKESQPCHVKLNEAGQVKEGDVAGFLNSAILGNSDNKVAVMKTESDERGFTHTRYSIQQKGITVFNKVIIAHCQLGKLVSLSGDLRSFEAPANAYAISADEALAAAVKKVNAKKYKWDNKEEEQHMREMLHMPDFSYAPNPAKTILEKDGNLYHAYKMTIYAEEPLYKANVFVDAATGTVLEEMNLICTVNVPGSMATKYSGTQTVTVDQVSANQYRMSETTRGLGVETRNLNYTANYNTSTSFTNATATWTGVNADQGARDAHWGAQKTYDYYFTTFNRNSIDNNGFKLLSYVHYNTNYQNAFWDGTRMTYGDGGSGTTIFTALDVCGHEITHGLTENTANLTYNNESGALNECFSDIFGANIENYARPANWNWKIGEDLTGGGGLRSMSAPQSFGDPNTYNGPNWYTGTQDNGGVHTNSNVGNYWYYLLTQGGSGTNGIGSAYNISGIGRASAASIAFRALTVYFTPTTDYITARALTIQAAKDLFGDCSNEVTQTANAWYAVGVGPAFTPNSVNPNFSTSGLSFCYVPVTVNFSNLTPNGITYAWDLGDGSAIATSTNVIHTYTASGSYTVKLKATGCANSVDSLIKPAHIVINVPTTPVPANAAICGAGSVPLSAAGNALLTWYPSPGSSQVLGTGSNFSTPGLTANTTYYVVNTVTNAPVFGGILTTVGTGNLNSVAQWLTFDVMENCTLNSVLVYASSPGNRVVEIRDAFANVIYTNTFNLTVGANTIPLNASLSPAVGLQLGLGGTVSNLYRKSGGVNYPYNVGGNLSITGSSAGNSYYYFFFNWKVTRESCSSAAIPVTASINAVPVVSITVPAAQVCSADADVVLSGSPAGGNFSGQGVAGSLFNPATAGVGSSAISYTYADANGCVGQDLKIFNVSECTGIDAVGGDATSIAVYPNPANEYLTVKDYLNKTLSVSLADVSGRIILSESVVSAEHTVNTGSIAKGVYMLSVRDASGNLVKTVKLVKE